MILNRPYMIVYVHGSKAWHHFKHIRLPKGPFRTNGHSNVYRAGWGDGNYMEDYAVTAVMKRKNPYLQEKKYTF